jgi:hypothetical protein
MADNITVEGFLNEFKQRYETLRESRPFCWILGSGASFQSGIPTGKNLAERSETRVVLQRSVVSIFVKCRLFGQPNS